MRHFIRADLQLNLMAAGDAAGFLTADAARSAAIRALRTVMADRLREGAAIPADWCVHIVDAAGEIMETLNAESIAFERSLERDRRSDAFNAAPHPYLLLNPDLAILDANPFYLNATMKDLAVIRRQFMFEAFPDNPDDQAADGVLNLAASFDLVRQTREPDLMLRQRYDLQRPDGSWVERYWDPVNVPVLDENGEIAFIVHHVEDVTETMGFQRIANDARTRFAEKARECERAARRITDLSVQRQMLDIAAQWRAMSRRT
jgi:PAS domain-containing protein